MLSPVQRRKMSGQINRYALQVAVVRRSQAVALFWSSDGEVDTLTILKTLLRRGVKVFLPVLHPLGDKRLWFCATKSVAGLQTNRYGIPEPNYRKSRPRPAWSLNLCFMPLVAFDATGNRMGMGGGYYDRTFCLQRNRPKLPRRIGLAYGFQEVKKLQQENWDVPLNGVVTEAGYRQFAHPTTKILT